MGTIFEADVDQYLPTPLSKALTQLIYRDGFPLWFVPELSLPWPCWSRKTNITSAKTQLAQLLVRCIKVSPTPATRTQRTLSIALSKLGHNTNIHCFEWLQQRPEIKAQFSNHIASTKAVLVTWMDTKYYPFEKNLVEGTATQEDAALLVDVGGNKGYDLQELCQKYRSFPGRFMLQDQASVIKEATGLDPRIIPTEHDFFTPQLVKGNTLSR